MRKILLGVTALAALSIGQARAGTIDVTSYGTPDSDAFNSVTTDGYSYYTGPILFNLSDGKSLLVYCADLTHDLSTPTVYQPSPLAITGAGTHVSATVSSEMRQIVALGINAFSHGNMDLAAAAQAAIWDVEYGTTSVSTNSTIAGDITTILAAKFQDGPGATALVPVGQSWYQNSGASQQMLTSVPEPASLALLGTGVVGLGLIRRRTAR